MLCGRSCDCHFPSRISDWRDLREISCDSLLSWTAASMLFPTTPLKLIKAVSCGMNEQLH